MFTGIVQNQGTVRSIDKAGDWRIVIDTALDLRQAPEGASVCCSGCCLTVVDKGPGWFAADVSAETLAKTTISNWGTGTKVNLESSLRLGDELGGHFVFGHVDGVAAIEKIEKDGDSYRITLSVPEALSRFIAPKGSVSLDGISLTVNGVSGQRFDVAIIPHTWNNTTLALRKPGDRLNIEIDMLARYVGRLMERDAA